MKTTAFISFMIVLLLTSCLKSNVTDPILIIDPYDYMMTMKASEQQEEGGTWSPVADGDTLRLSWTSSEPFTEQSVASGFGPGEFTYVGSGRLALAIDSAGVFFGNGDSIAFYQSYNHFTSRSGILDSAKFLFDIPYFYVLKENVGIKFEILPLSGF